MTYYIITIISIYSSIAAIVSLYLVAKNYHLSRLMEMYIFLTIVAMLYMLFVNLYNLNDVERDWKLPVTSLLWVGKTLFFSWAIRFSGLKKN